MPEEWLEVSYINFDKAIMHGRVTDGKDEFGVRREREIEQVLTEAQRGSVNDLAADQRDEMTKLLRSFVADQSQ